MSAIAGVFLNSGQHTEISIRNIASCLNWPGCQEQPREDQWVEGKVLLLQAHTPQTPEDAHDCEVFSNKEDRYRIIADAYLCNRADLAAGLGLSHAELKTISDRQLILKAWIQWREEMMPHLQGNYAFVIWDRFEQCMFAARDPLGLSPLFYAEHDGSVALASNLGALLAIPWVSRSLNYKTLSRFLLPLLPETQPTLYRNISAVSGGSFLFWKPGQKLISQQWWKAELPEMMQIHSHQEAIEVFSKEFHRAVKSNLRTIGEIGIRLSGGLDSAAVTAVAAESLASEGKQLYVIHDLPDLNDARKANHRSVDESHYVRIIEKHLENVSFHYQPTSDSVLPLADWPKLMEKKGTLFSAIPFEEDSSPAYYQEKQIKLLLNGLGGNYIVSWEAWPNNYFAWLLRTGKIFELIRTTKGYRDHYNFSLKQLLKSTIKGALNIRTIQSPEGFFEFPSNRLVNDPDQHELDVMEPISDFIDKETNLHPADLRARLLRNIRDLMPQCRGASAGGNYEGQSQIHSAFPMIDLQLNQRCLEIPPEMNVHQGWDRYLLRMTIKDKLPPEVVWRTDRGFPLPGSRRRFLKFKSISESAFADLLASLPNDGFLNKKILNDYWQQTPPHGNRWNLTAPLVKGLSIAVFLQLQQSET